ncbi:uncharacterized protein LOC143558289 [Bidens hawaiensis]|uniref:uncharacterized protein LOC143558289 n=1 Tax=Bidens hawaiensis TaxID=980011 RepID=UPI004048FD20
MRGREGLWCLCGDFNAVRNEDEKRNSKFNQSSASDFNSFIDEACLMEYGMKGKRFTFLTGAGNKCKMSKLDRFLVCGYFFSRWAEACCRALPRNLSDHCPILLSLVNKNFGARPFRWFNSWLDRDGCEEMLVNALDRYQSVGSRDVTLSNKFRFLRNLVRNWKAKQDVTEGEESCTLKVELESLEATMEHRDLVEEEEWVWAECKNGLEELELHRLKYLKQRSRVRWVMHGDDNTAYFHGVINGRKVVNAIQGILVDGVWVLSLALSNGRFSSSSGSISHKLFVLDLLFVVITLRRLLWTL